MSVPLPLSPTSASSRAAAAETTSLITRREEEDDDDDDGKPIKHKGRQCDICGWIRAHIFAPPMIKLMDIPLTKTQRIRFEDVRRRASVLYDPEQDEHVRSLYALGIAVFGESFAASDIKSDKWKLIGFQGTDPASDFRASGLFGLQNLAYFVHTQPRAFRRICGFTHERRDSNASTSSSSTPSSTPHVATVSDAEHYLPCALSGINITFMLTNLLSVRRSLREPMLPEAAQHFQAFVRLLECEMYAFEELYCECFLLLEELWHVHHARYMDFNNILARVREYVIAALERNPINMRDFHRIMSQISQS